MTPYEGINDPVSKLIIALHCYSRGPVRNTQPIETYTMSDISMMAPNIQTSRQDLPSPPSLPAITLDRIFYSEGGDTTGGESTTSS